MADIFFESLLHLSFLYFLIKKLAYKVSDDITVFLNGIPQRQQTPVVQAHGSLQLYPQQQGKGTGQDFHRRTNNENTLCVSLLF